MRHRGSSFEGRGLQQCLLPLQGGWQSGMPSGKFLQLGSVSVKTVGVLNSECSRFLSWWWGLLDPPLSISTMGEGCTERTPLGAELCQAEGWDDTSKILPMLVYESILGFCAPQCFCNSPIVLQSSPRDISIGM